MSRSKTTVFHPGSKRQVIRRVPVYQQFDSPIVARHMAMIAEENEKLRQWRKNRMGKRVSYREIRFV